MLGRMFKAGIGYIWSDSQDTIKIDTTKEQFDPGNQDHLSFIKNKIAAYKTQHDPAMQSLASVIYQTFGLSFIYKMMPLFISAPLCVLDVLYFQPHKQLLDVLKYYPQHFSKLNELLDLVSWMSEGIGVKITKDPLFVDLVKTVANLAPLEKILLWDLTKVRSSDVGIDYLKILSQARHNLIFVGCFENINTSTNDMEKEVRNKRSLQSLAELEYAFFGASSEKAALAKLAKNVTEMLPAAPKSRP